MYLKRKKGDRFIFARCRLTARGLPRPVGNRGYGIVSDTTGSDVGANEENDRENEGDVLHGERPDTLPRVTV